MKKVLISIVATALAVMIAPSCQKVERQKTPDSVTLYTHPGEPESFENGFKGVTIAATTDWTAVSDVEWLVVSPSSGGRGISEVSLSWTENTGSSPRSGNVKFTARGGQSETFVLTQNSQL